jgi:mono/diheme cytochrome c family protein
MRQITRAYTFPERDGDGNVVEEGHTYSPAELNKGRHAYVHYCYACHGMNGDGKGPASHGLRPPPRDFRIGAFKFGAVRSGEKPNDEDFMRIVRGGLHGTAMLPWDIANDELWLLVQFIKTFPQPPCNPFTADAACSDRLAKYPDHSLDPKELKQGRLVVRKGGGPILVVKSVQGEQASCANPDGSGDPESIPIAELTFPSFWEEVGTAGKAKGKLKPTGAPVRVPDTDPWAGKVEQAIKKGEELYHFTAQCANCHPAFVTKSEFHAAALALDPNAKPSFREGMYDSLVLTGDKNPYGVNLLPPDFTLNPLRSIRRPTHEGDDKDMELRDLYRLIASGVGGVMPQWTDALQPEQIWALAHYVKSLKNLSLPENREKRNALKDKLTNQAPFNPPAPKEETKPATDEGEKAKTEEGKDEKKDEKGDEAKDKEKEKGKDEKGEKAKDAKDEKKDGKGDGSGSGKGDGSGAGKGDGSGKGAGKAPAPAPAPAPKAPAPKAPAGGDDY